MNGLLLRNIGRHFFRLSNEVSCPSLYVKQHGPSIITLNHPINCSIANTKARDFKLQRRRGSDLLGWNHFDKDCLMLFRAGQPRKVVDALFLGKAIIGAT